MQFKLLDFHQFKIRWKNFKESFPALFQYEFQAKDRLLLKTESNVGENLLQLNIFEILIWVQWMGRIWVERR